MDLLTLCPAYHNEASNILYSDNTFLVATHPDTYIDAASLGLLGQWLRSIGPTHQDEVREVLVNLSPLCPWPTRDDRVIIDLKEIMMQLWRRQNRLRPDKLIPDYANIRISFTLSGRQLHNLCTHLTGAHLPPALQYIINIHYLNRVITLLSPSSRPSMKYSFHSPQTLR